MDRVGEAFRLSDRRSSSLAIPDVLVPFLGASVVRLLILLAIAGALGSLARYALGLLARQVAGPQFPWGTWVVNLLGCLFFGWVVARYDRSLVSDETRLILLVGFAGAFTTFSTLAFDTVALAREGRWSAAIANMVLQNLGGLVAILVGLRCGGIGPGRSV